MADLERTQALQQLRAAVYALGALVVFVGATALLDPFIKARSMGKLMARSFTQKDQGELLQRDAFALDSVLPVYGSSELNKPVKTRAGEFFKSVPTGFRICPVGKAGNTCLLIAEKLAAIGDSLRDRKIALILSSTWFLADQEPEGFYAGNFSTLQAMSLALDDSLDADLRKRLVTRMLDYPTTLASQPLLQAYLQKIVGPKPATLWERMQLDGLRQLLRLNRLIFVGEDHINTAVTALCLGADAAPLGPEDFSPERELLASFKPAAPSGETGPPAITSQEKAGALFAQMKASKEWTDLGIMLDILKSFKAKPLVLSIPLPPLGQVTRELNDYYHQRLASMCAERGIAVELWANHAGDTNFFIGNTTHFTENGWIEANQCLDRFYHDCPLYPIAVTPKP